MFFSQQALDEMSEARKAIGGKYESLLMKYVMLPLKDTTAKEYATQGFPRRLTVLEMPEGGGDLVCIYGSFGVKSVIS
jgi:hypothetical protein